MMRIVPLAATLAALLGGLAAPAAQAAFPGENGPFVQAHRAAFDGQLGGRGVFVRSIGTTKGATFYGCSEEVPPRAVNSCEARLFANPAVSADGRVIAFEDDDDISLVDSDGSGYRTLDHPELLGTPAFSPDGRRLAVTFYGARTGLDPDLAVAVVDLREGGRVRRLTDGESPTWSTRGWIAFIRWNQLFRIRPDGSGLRQLTRRGCRDASWSPNGRRIACARKRGLVTMTADGRDLRRIPSGPSEQFSMVRWSPDGRYLAAGDPMTLIQVVDMRGRIQWTEETGALCGAEYCWWRNGWDWAPASESER